MLCGWEGNRRSGVALAMHHRLKWCGYLWAQRPRKGDEHPAHAPVGYGTFTLCAELWLWFTSFQSLHHCLLAITALLAPRHLSSIGILGVTANTGKRWQYLIPISF